MVEEPDYVKIALRQIGSQAAKWGLGAAAAGALTGLAASAGARRHAAGAREELAELNKNRPGRSSSPRDKRVHDFIRRAAEIDVANAERARAHPNRPPLL